MSFINWSDEQRLAIKTRGCNLLVSAAAGSGKTAVLVERIIQSLLQDNDPVDIDRLLVVTFTEAAAGEMRQRISTALAEVLQDRPGSSLLQRQILLLPRANIGTIHSFCSEVIRSHFYLLDLDPGFRVMDENEASMLRSEVMDEVLEKLYDECRDVSTGVNALFLDLVRGLAGGHGDDTGVITLAFSLYDFAHSLPRPGAWLKSLPEFLQTAADLSWEEQPWIEEWRAMLQLEISNWVEILEEARLLVTGSGGPVKYEQVLLKDLERVKSWLDLVNEPFSSIKEALDKGRRWPSLPRVARGEAQEDIKKRIQKLRSGVKKKVTDFYDQFLSRSARDMVEDFKVAASAVRALVDLVLRFKESYTEAKRDRGVVDFSDLEHLALAVLARNGEESPWGEGSADCPEAALLPSPVALQYQEQFSEVLVDEYQDINAVQEAIIQIISRPNNRFMVGDVKQSIYRFRLADPSVFLNCYQKFNDIHSPKAEPGRRLDLQSNFRSHPAVLQAVNYFFQRLMDRRVAEVDYDERARLNPGKTYPADRTSDNTVEPVELHLLEYADLQNTSGSEEDAHVEEPEQEELDQIQLEARWIAGYVKRLVIEEQTAIYDNDKGYRPATWRDIVVLMRSLKGRVGIFLEEFRRLGIPVYADGSGGYFSAPEVQTILSLLQVIDNPRRDIPLAAVLRSPVVGLDAGDLAKIRLIAPEGDFYTAVCQAAEKGEVNKEKYADLVHKLQDFLGKLETWRDLARRLPPADLLEELYRQTGYYHLVGAIPGGAVRQANLRALVDRARRFEGTLYRGLFRFLRFIEQVQERGGDMDTARSLGENEDVVRVMSIHRSKGLEFPIVVVAGLGRSFNFRDLSRSFLWHRRLGCGPVVIDLQRGIRYPTVLHRVIRHRLRLETLAEEMRLLYVAFTRARERLIITGIVKRLDRKVTAWRSQTMAVSADNVLSASLLAGAKGPLDWLGPAMWLHPNLKNVFCKEEPEQAGGDSWRVFLWPAASLSFLWGSMEQHSDWQSEAWVKCIKQLEPIPRGIIESTGQDYKIVDPAILEHKLFWSYPYKSLSGLPSKVSVTEWRHRHEEMEYAAGEIVPTADIFNLAGTGAIPAFDLPAFYTGKHLDGAEKGRAVHLVMENLRLVPAPDLQDIKHQLDLLVDKDILGPEQRHLIRTAEIARFFSGELGQRVLNAAREKRVWREVPFTLGLSITELYPELAGTIPGEELILLQGVIDCLLVEKDGLVVIDYKTDRITEEQLSKTVNKYRLQLELYARAAQTILARPVVNSYLYFFALDRAVECL